MYKDCLVEKAANLGMGFDPPIVIYVPSSVHFGAADDSLRSKIHVKLEDLVTKRGIEFVHFVVENKNSNVHSMWFITIEYFLVV